MPGLNLGSGTVRIDGYLNVDINEAVAPDVVADVLHLPFEDDSIDDIIASHILEHFEHDAGALEEWHRVLRPGGQLLVAVPEFFEMYELYRAGFSGGLCFLNRAVYGHHDADGYQYPPMAHRQIFTASILCDQMRPLFPDVALAWGTDRRPRQSGEAIAVGHKRG